MKFFRKLFAISALIAYILTTASPVFAFSFDPNNIISDADFVHKDALDLGAIQTFLESQPGTLAWLVVPDMNGVPKRASEIIYEAAQKNRINPKVLITKLQKEQSLVTNPTPSQYNLDWAMGYGVCDDCSVSDPRLQKFKGFGSQVGYAASRLRQYIDEADKFNFQPGIARIVDDLLVTPFNRATANLYNYTPHLLGNMNFWKIWNRWFAKQYPDGTLVRQDTQPGVWLIENGVRRPFWSKTALVTRFPNTPIISISRNDLERYEIGSPLKFPNYSLVKNVIGDIYLLVNSEKKKIASSEVFRTLGYNPEEVIDVTDEDIAAYADGRQITLESVYPTGTLLMNSKNGGVYYVEDGIKYPIWSKDILTIRFGAKTKISKVSPEHLDTFPTGQPVKLPDGTLVQAKGQKAIYVISHGAKRLIANQQTFDQLGYKKDHVKTVSEKTLEAHPDGETVDLLIPTQTDLALTR